MTLCSQEWMLVDAATVVVQPNAEMLVEMMAPCPATHPPDTAVAAWPF